MNFRRFGTAAVTLATVVGLLLALGPRIAETQGGGWEWQNPLPQGHTLRGVWGSCGMPAEGETGGHVPQAGLCCATSIR